VKRPPGSLPPCRTCPKIPAGEQATPGAAVNVDERTIAAYEHWRECRAVGQWPDDEVTRRLAVAFEAIENERKAMAEERRLTRAIGLLVAQMAVKGKR
jgi:hypothetical protein